MTAYTPVTLAVGRTAAGPRRVPRGNSGLRAQTPYPGWSNRVGNQTPAVTTNSVGGMVPVGRVERSVTRPLAPAGSGTIRVSPVVDEAPESAEVAPRADRLKASSDGAGKPDDRVTGPGERRDFELHMTILRHGDGECLLPLFRMARECPVGECPAARLLDHLDDSARCSQGDEGRAKRHDDGCTWSNTRVLRKHPHSG
jgi:hypothetical protein